MRSMHIRKLEGATLSWDAPEWDVPGEPLSHFMGARPEHFPATEFKLGYDAEGLTVLFRVEDQYVRAPAREHQGPVWKDSCVEFFFSPLREPAGSYFNLEMNCGGMMLFNFHAKGDRESVAIPVAVCETIPCEHSLPSVVDPERAGAVTWTVGYRLPFELFAPYGDLEIPASGVEWRANFYKCADESSHPHWLTWSPVDLPKPNFHVPEYFGRLVFD